MIAPDGFAERREVLHVQFFAGILLLFERNG
jgi:hypothetical protein